MEAAARLLAEPRECVSSLSRQEVGIRFEAAATQQAESRSAAVRDILRRLTKMLEFTLVFVGVHEAALELRIETIGALKARIHEVIAAAGRIVRLDAERVFTDCTDLLPPASAEVPPDDRRLSIDMRLAVDSLRATVAFFPADMIESVADRAGDPDLAHRCRTVVQGLHAFVRRNDPSEPERVRVAGTAYAEGRLTLAEVAQVLQISRSDAVALLEERGFCRPPSVIAIDEDDRATLLQAIRRDRLARGGAAQRDEGLLIRSVVASQRIEGVDARPWLRRG